jgi:hypothetical protein
MNVINLNENIGKYHYWSNSCGETHHWGEYDIEPEELPKELKRVLDDLFVENKFGLNVYLTEFGGEYGISIEANYNEEDADNIYVPYDDLLKTVMVKADLIATKFPQYKILFGKDVIDWSDSSKDSIMTVFMPWDISEQDFDATGEIVGRIAY